MSFDFRMALKPLAAAVSPLEQDKKYQLTVNAYDRTATLIIALLILVGFTTLCLSLIFFADNSKVIVQPVSVMPMEATSPTGNQGLADQPDPPGLEEASDLIDPQVGDVLESLTVAATASEVLLSDESLVASAQAGKGKGLGDARMPGKGGDGVVERVPRWERWKIRFEPDSLAEFEQWLDYHKIEIGVLGRDNQVHYAYNLSQAAPETRSAAPALDNRFYTSAADGPMPQLTEKLARKADIAKLGSVVLLFYPLEVESALWTLEQQYAKGRDVNTIRETIFTVTHDADRFGFEIVNQHTF